MDTDADSCSLKHTQEKTTTLGTNTTHLGIVHIYLGEPGCQHIREHWLKT